jgi:hypothetical protein
VEISITNNVEIIQKLISELCVNGDECNSLFSSLLYADLFKKRKQKWWNFYGPDIFVD